MFTDPSLEAVPALSPLSLFAIEATLLYGRGTPTQAHLLPSSTALCNEDPVASLYGSWNETGLTFLFIVQAPLHKTDRIELWIDTRNLKTRSSPSRFCHHFLFLPGDGTKTEVTHMRLEELHPLAQQEQLALDVVLHKNSYHALCQIFASGLHGFDPDQEPCLGFTYRLSLRGGKTQFFALPHKESTISQSPALWSTLRLSSDTSS